MGGEADDRGRDGWMASPTRWTWVWVSSWSWWWTGKPGMLQSMGSQRVRHNWVTDLNWVIPFSRGSFWFRDWTLVSYISGGFFTAGKWEHITPNWVGEKLQHNDWGIKRIKNFCPLVMKSNLSVVIKSKEARIVPTERNIFKIQPFPLWSLFFQKKNENTNKI